MTTQAVPTLSTAARAAVSPRHALLESLIATATGHFNDHFNAFATQLAGALVDSANMDGDIGLLQLRLRAGNLLRNRQFAFLHLASTALEKALRMEFAQLGPKPARAAPPDALELVPYEVMDEKLTLSTVCKPFDAKYSDALATLNVRLAFMMQREILRAGQNPFRPEVFIGALQEAWAAFNPEAEAAGLLLPMLRPGAMVELGPLYEALNLALQRKGFLPGDAAGARVRRADSHDASGGRKRQQDEALAVQLRQLFGRGGSAAADPLADVDLSLPAHALGPSDPNAPPPPWSAAARSKAYTSPFARAAAQQGAVPGTPQAAPQVPAWFSAAHQAWAAARPDAASPAPAADPAAERERLMSWLAWLQKSAPPPEPEATPHNVIYLPTIKQGAPRGTLSHADESTIDLLTAVFETVFRDQDIAREIRELVLLLQIPVLKAALADKDFFFQEAHPARRLIELLSKMGWEQRRDKADPVYQAMQRSVERIGRDPQQELQTFSQAVDELEQSIRQDEQAADKAIAEPIAAALKEERRLTAERNAKDAVALRIGTGEVVAVIETFLENQWTSVLTLAYTVEEAKPGAIRNATETMDDLIWSVKPKITPEQRKQLIGKLPGLLTRLNQWLDAIKWQSEDRLRFFAELADCHASIVRAPVELAPERQLELSMQAAQKAAERREELKARPAEAEPQGGQEAVDGLARGMWLEFDQEEGEARKVKLAWASPQRTLFIFSSRTREEAFTLSGEELARRFAEGGVRVAENEGVVSRALVQALAANEEISPSAASSM
ncbi:DUF1631 family protein [Massilia endophytica]|uniref:DUF1631 family protein n=1 Tax=Massilia endophytica TaxID=2899220 RepID=UPI001E52FC16|nr:DUF1631 family protein [Massilia endophytica]UGQ48893.1 DUF1631 domain-containing protein [Massilia endophytica]